MSNTINHNDSDFMSAVGADKEALNEFLKKAYSLRQDSKCSSPSEVFELLRDSLSYNELLALATLKVTDFFESKERK